MWKVSYDPHVYTRQVQQRSPRPGLEARSGGGGEGRSFLLVDSKLLPWAHLISHLPTYR